MSFEERRPLRQRGQLPANIVANELLLQRKSFKPPAQSLVIQPKGTSHCSVSAFNVFPEDSKKTSEKSTMETKTEEETEVCCSQDKNYLKDTARVEGATPG